MIGGFALRVQYPIIVEMNRKSCGIPYSKELTEFKLLW